MLRQSRSLWNRLFARSRGERPPQTVPRARCRPRLETLEDRLAPAALPRPDHIVIVIEENKDFADFIGSPSAPYLNSLTQQGALMTASAGVEHPSQPNYLDLFSGSNQGVTSNDRPAGLPFSTPNLGAQLFSNGLSFVGYAESLPSVGFDGDVFTSIPGQNQYERKHNPWSNWVNNPAGTNQLPSSVNRPFSNFPTDYSDLPTVAFVVPNEQNNMHDGTIQQGDTWLKDHLDGYVQWAKDHNSLLVVTFDENDGSPGNRIPTIFVGPMVKSAVTDSQPINHFNVLRTIEDMYSLPTAGASAGAAPITAIWKPTIVSVTPAAGFTEAQDASAQDLSDSGTVKFDELNAANTVTISSRYNNDVAWSGGTLSPGLIAQLTSGTFTASVAAAAVPGTTPWTYTATDVNLDFLAKGGKVTFSFKVTATDSGTPTAGTDTDTVRFTITGTNDAPTLTTSVSPVDATTPGVEVELTFADLAAKGNEADVDGAVTAFIVQAVSSGTLKIGASSGAATPFAVGSNNTIDATHKAYWKAAVGAKGPGLTAFTIVAKDNQGALSTGAVQVTVDVNLSNFVYIDFGTNGFWRWSDATGYQLVHPADVETFSVGADGFVYIDFGVYGLWRWADAVGFQPIHALNPENVVAGPDGYAYIDFGSNGFWRWSQAAGFFQIHAANPENITISNDGFAYIDFGNFGLYRWSQATGFTLIHAANPENIQAGADNFLYIDFGVYGFYRWSSASFQLIHGANPEGFTTGSDGFVTIDFGSYGLYRRSSATGFVQIHPANVEEVVAGNGLLFIDFGSAGLWRWSQATGFLQIHPVSPQRIRA
jgi:VCBS repeat-containing protein